MFSQQNCYFTIAGIIACVKTIIILQYSNKLIYKIRKCHNGCSFARVWPKSSRNYLRDKNCLILVSGGPMNNSVSTSEI